MRRKLLMTYCILILVSILTSLVAYGKSSYSYLMTQNEEKNLHYARLLCDIFAQIDNGEEETRRQFVDEYSNKYDARITLIAQAGDVVADSLNESLENHSNRQEVLGALEGSEETVERYSTTLKTDCMYVAMPISSPHFQGAIRLCVTLENIQVLEDRLIKGLILSLVIGLVLSFFGAFIFSQMLSKPIEDVTRAAKRISKGKYDTKIYTKEKTQIGEFAESFNLITNNLNKTIEKLTQRNVELEAIIGSMGAGVIAIDERNKILSVNQDFLKMFELTPKFTEGRALYNVVREKAIFEVIDQVQEKQERIVTTTQIQSPKEIDIRITGCPLIKEDGNTFGILLIINDITRVNKLESMRKDFVSNVTHELKTPLTSIHGFVDTLRQGAIEDQGVAQHFLEIIDIETERLSSLINDILTLSEIETKKDYHCEPCQINDQIQKVIELIECHTNERVRLMCECDPNLPLFLCNPARMEQLLINLVENAVKYTEVGTVEVSSHRFGDEIVIRIADTGIGIPKDQLERIFERFYRVDKGRSRRQGGTGLGLSIVKHIVELYNGTIHVESELGKGSVFEVRLPIQKS